MNEQRRYWLLALGLTVSVLLNGWLLWLQFEAPSRATSRDAAGASGHGGEATAFGGGVPDAMPRAPLAEERSRSNAPPATLDSKEDLVALRDWLTRAGLPPRLVRAAVSAAVNEQIDPEIVRLTADSDLPYWKRMAQGLRREATVELRRLSREKQALLTELLGEVPDLESARRSRELSFGSSLSRTKVDAIGAIINDYNDLLDLYARTGTAEDDRRIREELLAQRRDDIAALLTPEELRDYDLHQSLAARFVARRAANLEVTDEEFGRLYDVQKVLYTLDGTGGSRPATPEERFQVDCGYLDVLGSERFVQLLASDHNKVYEVMTRYDWDLPPERRVKVWRVLSEASVAFSNAMRQGNSTAEGRSAWESQSQAVREELATELGEAASQEFLATDGQWLLRTSGGRAPAGNP